MKLNDQIAGLPEWPVIERDEATSEYRVRARHLSYGQYLKAKNGFSWTAGALMLGGLLFGISTEGGSPERALSIWSFVVGMFVAWFVAFDEGKRIARLLFKTETVVRFSPQSVVINGTVFDVQKVASIQFISSRPALSEERIAKLQAKERERNAPGAFAYDMRYRRIEMLYGLRAVTITSVEDQDKAAQFVLALQSAYELSRAAGVGPSTKNGPRRARGAYEEEVLPE